MKRIGHILVTLTLSLVMPRIAMAQPAADIAVDDTIVSTQAGSTGDAAASDDAVAPESDFSPKEIIFEHLGDGYGWEVPFNHHKRIPLPVILWASDGVHVFSSSRVSHGHVFKDGNVSFAIAGEGDYAGKVVEINPDGSISKPWDISITKNVLAVFISVILVILCVFPLGRWYRTRGYVSPRGFKGAMEALYEFIYVSLIKATLKEQARRFAPYLLTVFMFIFVSNLMGLMVIFPGGANLTGNIAVTMVLALLTFFITNIFGTKHYWKEILWPDVPLWLKFPLPIMPVIEIFGMFTKPAALTVRLFANMMGGHIIVISLTLIIFIFAKMGVAALSGATVVSMIFQIFMLLIDVLVSFIQAYVFTMLSTIFISLAQEHGGHENAKHAESDILSTPATE